MKLTVYNPHSREAAASAATRIQELERLLSVTEEDSEIYAANHSGGTPVTVSQDTFRLLTRALELCESTGGALDVTILPVLQAWGFTTDAYRVPGEQELSKLLERVDYRKISLVERILTLPNGMQLDLGAVAKGYTGDQLMGLFKNEGVTSAIVELGGNVQALGAKPDGSPWRVGIQSPEGNGYAGVLEVVDRAVVTSGGYQRYFEKDSETYWHILDPADGRHVRSGLASVTIVAEEGAVCDGLSTKMARYALLVALAVVLSWLESVIPLPAAVPGMKLGLTNLVVIFALYRLPLLLSGTLAGIAIGAAGGAVVERIKNVSSE